jgi:hypothetical protein
LTVAPDLTGCPFHGNEDYRVYRYADGRIERRCLVCRRNRQAATHNNGDRCRKRGHLKTPWTWRRYGPHQHGRCLLCQYERQRERQPIRSEQQRLRRQHERNNAA